MLAIAPESNLAIVILSNSVNTGRFHGLSINLLDSCAMLKGRKPYVKSQLTKSVTDTLILGEKDLEKFSGLYANPEFVFELISKNNKLHTKVQDNEYILTPLKDGSFMPNIITPGGLHALSSVRFEFLKIENNDFIIYHSLPNDKRHILGTKFYRQEIDSLWISRIGTYEIVEPNEADFQLLSSIELVIENGVLVLNQMEEYEGSAIWNTAISVKDDNIAFPLGLGRQRGSTLLFESENGKEILWFSGYKLKKVE